MYLGPRKGLPPAPEAGRPRPKLFRMSAWWRSAILYEIYPRSFADADGDGTGDLAGIETRLQYLKDLGVDGIWITPFFVSPMNDGGYDVANPRDVDPLFGTLQDFDRLVESAHAIGLRILIDNVPNHTSSEHRWFQEALNSPPGSRARRRYIFRRGKNGGNEPPNDWKSQFGGPAWTRAADGEWYLHLFAPSQPDLNWDEPEVRKDAEKTLQFWLDRGVDGFRIDVAFGLIKAKGLPDVGPEPFHLMSERAPQVPMWNQPGVHAIFRDWRKLADDHAARDPVLVGEVCIGDVAEVAKYVRPDELSLAFNFRLLHTKWDLPQFRRAIEPWIAGMNRVGSPPTWVLSNHDEPRQVTRYGDGDTGVARARAAAQLMFALPGTIFLYQGEELGLPEFLEIPDAQLQDPIFKQSQGLRRGRDGCRVPFPWNGVRPPYGFTQDGVATWLPQPEDWAGLTVAAQQNDSHSMLQLYRRAIALRGEWGLAAGDFSWIEIDAPLLGFRRGSEFACYVNFGDDPLPLPSGEVVLASRDLAAGMLPGNTAVWVRPGKPKV